MAVPPISPRHLAAIVPGFAAEPVQSKETRMLHPIVNIVFILALQAASVSIAFSLAEATEWK